MDIRPGDEILYTEDDNEGDPEKSTRLTSVFFADGTRLVLSAITPTPPESELTETKVKMIDRNTGEESVVMDTFPEAWELENQATAPRMYEAILKLLEEIPEREKDACPLCDGAIDCQYCEGKGCMDCNQTGNCQTCKGKGWIFAEVTK